MLSQRIVELLRTKGPLSRAELSRLGGVSKPTVSSVVKTLLKANLVFEDGMRDSIGGRPARLLHFNARVGYVIGMDIGGTKARASVADLLGNVLASTSEPTQASHLDAFVAQVQALCRTLLDEINVSEDDLKTIVIGTPGVVNPATGQLEYAHNLPALQEHDALATLHAVFEQPLLIFNDVNLAALGEHWNGAVKNVDDFVFISIGTGLGFGIVHQGELFQGSQQRAGEFGYIPYPPGGRTTLEDVVSGPGIARRHCEAGGSGRPEDIFAEASQNESPGNRIVQDFLDDLAWMIAGVATLLDPQHVVLGGGIGVRCGPYLAALQQRTAELTPIVPKIVVSKLLGDAGLYGAIATALLENRSVASWLEGGDA